MYIDNERDWSSQIVPFVVLITIYLIYEQTNVFII